MDKGPFITNLSDENIDICTVNRDRKFWLNLVIWGRLYDVIHEWQADVRNVTRGA
jgi:hypothetical protein